MRAVTTQAVHAVCDTDVPVPEAARQGRRLLSSLPDLPPATHSPRCCWWPPLDRLAVYDRRARRGLELLGDTLTSSSGRYGRYMHAVQNLLELAHERQRPWIARDVYLALYWLGR